MSLRTLFMKYMYLGISYKWHIIETAGIRVVIYHKNDHKYRKISLWIWRGGVRNKAVHTRESQIGLSSAPCAVRSDGFE